MQRHAIVPAMVIYSAAISACERVSSTSRPYLSCGSCSALPSCRLWQRASSTSRRRRAVRLQRGAATQSGSGTHAVVVYARWELVPRRRGGRATSAAARATSAAARPGEEVEVVEDLSDLDSGVPPFGTGRRCLGPPLSVGRGSRLRELQRRAVVVHKRACRHGCGACCATGIHSTIRL